MEGAHHRPSRILRDCTPNAKSDDFVKIQSELHGDMQSQAEMTWPTATRAVVTKLSVPICRGRWRIERICP